MAERININDVLETSDTGTLDRSVTDALYGLNTSPHRPMLQSNKDFQGFTFFTRPLLNLTEYNIRNVRQLYPLLSKKEASAQRFVRCTLDPTLYYGHNDVMYNQPPVSCPLVDPFNPFIPILSNTITNLSGWPDVTVPSFTSSAGIRKEQFSMIDGTYEIFDVFDLNATFNNFVNEPLTLLFQTWLQYPAFVFEGMLNQYLGVMLANEIDYNTRIYRFVMDKTGRYIKKHAATGASYPISSPMGKFFDFSSDKPYNEQTGEINIPFKCMGAMYNDDRVLLEFNTLMSIFNPDVLKYLQGDTSSMEAIPYDILSLFNYRAYPIVDLDTYELKWLISKNSPTYNKIMEYMNGKDPLTQNITETEDANEQKAIEDAKNALNMAALFKELR